MIFYNDMHLCNTLVTKGKFKRNQICPFLPLKCTLKLKPNSYVKPFPPPQKKHSPELREDVRVSYY